MRVTVSGAGSLIAQALRAQHDCRDWRFLSHQQALHTDGWLDDTDVLLNCALDPRLKALPWQADWDVDLMLARRIAPHPHIRQVMLSSRLAYGQAPADGRLHEALPALPTQPYGRAKRATEEALATVLGTRLMVLRLSNIFGDEDLPGRQNFLAMALRALREEGCIALDMTPFVARDFLPVEQLALWLVPLLQQWQPGLFNVGAGWGTPTGRIAQWLIEGRGDGEMKVTRMREHDGFWLDMGRTHRHFDLPGMPPDLIRDRCRQLGAKTRPHEEVSP